MSDTETKSVRRLLKVIWVTLIANIFVIFGAIWWASSIDHRVSQIEKDEVEIKETMIDPMQWKYNNYFTLYMWAERWGQPLPEPLHNTRGGAPNI